MPTIVKKIYNTFQGENLRSPELIRDQSTSTGSINVLQSDNLSLSKRKGYQVQTSGQGGSGAVTFNRINIASGVTTLDRLVVDNNLHREVDNDIQITYSGTGEATYTYLLNADTVFELVLYVNGIMVSSNTFGSGTTNSEVGTNAIVDHINSVVDFSAIDNGVGSNRAAFVQAVENTLIDTPLMYKTFEQVNNAAGVTEAFAGHYATRNTDSFELMQFAQTNNSLYITNGIDGLFKYDGSTLYRAGMPDAEEAIISPITGALTGSFVYRYFYEYTDVNGAVFRSNLSNAQEVNLASQDGSLVIPNILEGSGYDTASGNITINILRTQDNGTILYEIGQVPNDPLSATTTFVDSSDDSLLLVDFAVPINNPRQPPACRYIDIFRTSIVLTGSSDSVNEVFFSDVQSPEGFPFENRFLTRSRFGGPNSGIKSQDNYLYVFKPNSISVVTGSLETLQFEVDILSDEGIGCLSANSLVEVLGKIYFLSRQGIYSIFQGGTPVEESVAHKPYYNTPTFEALRCVSFNWIQERVILFLLPVFDIIEGEKVLNQDESIVTCMALETNSWFTWKGLDFSGGISLDEDEVWFNGSLIEGTNTVRKVNQELLMLNTSRDFADHNKPIEFSYGTHWDNAGDATIDKNYNRVRIYSVSEPLTNFTSTGFVLDLESNFNFSTGPITRSSKDFSGGSEGFGLGAWGEFPWGDVPLAGAQFNLSRRKCQVIRLVMSNNNLHENVLLSGYEFEVSAPYRSEIKGNL